MRYYLDVISGYVAKMIIGDLGVIFDGVYYNSVEEALQADKAKIWAQCG